MRLTVMSGAGAKLDNGAFVYPFLQRMMRRCLAVDAGGRGHAKPGSDVERGRFVSPIRNDGSLNEHVSTVDDAEWFVGWAASVMALQDARGRRRRPLRRRRGRRRRPARAPTRERDATCSRADAPERCFGSSDRSRPLSGGRRPSVGALTLLSRLTGFARVLVVTAVLGRGVLGDTYETANTVPNLLFELFAAGALQAVLVPAMVDVLDRDGRTAADRVAGAVLGALASPVERRDVMAAVAAPWIMRALTASTDAAIHDAKVELGTLLLWFFLPQVLFYAIGLVATAVLNAE